MNDYLTAEFLKDFYQEAREHLQQINAHLLEMEQVAPRAGQDLRAGDRKRALVEELFRSYHTLKGLCGMVGLEAGAELGHALESTLRDVQHDRLAVTPELIDLLLEGSRVLGEVVETVQDDSLPMPDVAPLIERIAQARGAGPAVTPPPTAPAAEEPTTAPPPGEAETLSLPPALQQHMTPADWRQVSLAQQEGKTLTLVTFEPSPQTAAQGINVNTVRERLSAVGVMIKGVPLIEGRRVRFLFLVASEQPLSAEAFPALTLQPLAAPAPPAERPAPPATAFRRVESASQIRVEAERLDDLMALVGDLVVTRSRLRALLRQLDGRVERELREHLDEELGRMSRQLRDLREAVMRVRLVPLAEVFSRMPLAVRDVSRALHKQVRLAVRGEDTEIDKQVADRLLDPLLHLVRNAVTHGIEPPDVRRAAGKPEEGTLTLSGHAEGDLVVIEVADDGAGVDLEAVARKAAALGWLEAGRAISAQEALEFLTRPGFTTRQQADLGAGRGVGMDVVAQTVADLGGSLSMDTAPGQGTRFTLRLPLTVTIVDALLVQVADRRFAVPLSRIRQALEVEPARVVQHMGVEIISLQGQSLPLLSVAGLFGLPATDSGRRFGLRVQDRLGEAVLAVDRLLDIREVVVRPITDPLIARPGIGGATELGDGSVVLVLDVRGLLAFARQQRQGTEEHRG